MGKKEKFNYMLNTLPESYSYIGDLIDILKEDNQTADYIRNKIVLAKMKNQKDLGRKRQTHLPQTRMDATNVGRKDILHESAKMAAKRDATADHGEVQHVAGDAAEPEGATMAEGATAAEDSVTSMETARAKKAAKERVLG